MNGPKREKIRRKLIQKMALGGREDVTEEGRDSSSLPNVFNPIHPLSNGFCRCVRPEDDGAAAAVAVVAFMMTGGQQSMPQGLRRNVSSL